MLRAWILGELALMFERWGHALLATAKRLEHVAINAWADYSGKQQFGSCRDEDPEMSGHLQ